MRGRRTECAPRDKAQNEWNAPGEGDEKRRPAARMQRVLPQHPEPPLQLEERAAMRREIFPDPARFVIVRVEGDVRAPHSQIRHVPRLLGPRPSWPDGTARARCLADIASIPRPILCIVTPTPPPTAPPLRSGTRA